MKLGLSKVLLYHHLSPNLHLFLISSNSSLHPCPSRVYSEQSDSVKHKSNHITPLLQSPRWLPSHSEWNPRSSYDPRGPTSLTLSITSSQPWLSPPQPLWSFCSPNTPGSTHFCPAHCHTWLVLHHSGLCFGNSTSNEVSSSNQAYFPPNPITYYSLFLPYFSQSTYHYHLCCMFMSFFSVSSIWM